MYLLHIITDSQNENMKNKSPYTVCKTINDTCCSANTMSCSFPSLCYQAIPTFFATVLISRRFKDIKNLLMLIAIRLSNTMYM